MVWLLPTEMQFVLLIYWLANQSEHMKHCASCALSLMQTALKHWQWIKCTLRWLFKAGKCNWPNRFGFNLVNAGFKSVCGIMFSHAPCIHRHGYFVNASERSLFLSPFHNHSREKSCYTRWMPDKIHVRTMVKLRTVYLHVLLLCSFRSDGLWGQMLLP